MKFETRKPGLTITLIKNVSRITLDSSIPVASRYTGTTPTVDLTPYLGEHNSVRTNKSVREPAGSFSITLTDQLYYPGTTVVARGPTSYGDSLYALIEPMDSIEIRMTGNAYKSAIGPTQQPPIKMRGFVSKVEKSEAMGADGKPQRHIIVSGQDYGKILQMIQIFHLPGIPASDAGYITDFPFATQFGLANNIMPANEFVQGVFDKVINPYVQALLNNTSAKINTDIVVSGGQVSPYGTGGWNGGTIYSLFMSLGDIGPWNEFFIEDREDGPYAVYRPNPFYAVDNTPIFDFPDGKFPVVTIIDRADIVSITAARTDANVANYFWVDCPRFNLNYEPTLRAFAVQAAQQSAADSQTLGPYVTGYANVDPKLYGQRKMTAQTNQGGANEKNNGNATPKGAGRVENQGYLLDWIKQRRIDLIAQNKDNIVFEAGAMRIKGNENIKAGTYIGYQAGDVLCFYYVVSAEDDYAPFGNYFTSVQYERGTGFIARMQQDAESQSPYLAEMVDHS
jgi:hypothetical protein